MDKVNIQEILPFVDMPSRYLGSESNSIKKDLSKVELKFALAFPDLYEIGTSHFGMQILYTILNKQDNIAAERFFTPAADMERILREKSLPLFSLESEVNLKSFDIVGFSLLYELNFTNILTMLNLSGIPFYSKDRNDFISTDIGDRGLKTNFPLIIAGGPCTFNPEPLADFFDAFVIGDGEKSVLAISEAFIHWKRDGGSNRTSLLKKLAKIDGVYIPSFFKPSCDEKGIQTLQPLEDGYQRIKRSILPNISTTPFPTSPVVPFGKPVHDRLRLEIARGCSRGCRFCQAGMIYRPVRERSVDELIEIAKEALQSTGYSDLSLLSLSTGDYENLAQLMENLMAMDLGHCISLSLPSVRAGKLNASLMKIIKKVKKTGFTIAPEAGSQRLRDVINKNITEEDIFTTVNSAFELGWRNIKLYFMNGLPTEKEEDIEAIADMVKKLAKIKTTGKGKSTISISFASFIPKPHTPFEKCSQIHPDKSMANLNFLKQHLKHPNISIKWQHPKMSLLEGVWARGDRRLSSVLIKAWEKGCRLDGWSDMFRFDLWQQAFDECGVDPYFYTTREREKDEILPWSHIDCGISQKFMEAEFDKAMKAELTKDCREHSCTGCGICDFTTIKPVLFKKKIDDINIENSSQNRVVNKKIEQNGSYTKITIFYSKLGKSKYFGHLELAKIIRRAIRRSGIKVKYSTGFSPAMKISFDNPLPVGMESEEEFFSIQADLSEKRRFFNSNSYLSNDLSNSLKESTPIKPEDIVQKLNQLLPQTIKITRCIYSNGSLLLNPLSKITSYKVDLKTFSVSRQLIDDFMSLSEYVVEKLNFKGIQRVIDLRKIVDKIGLIDSGDSNYTQFEIALKNDDQRTIRPSEILTEVFKVPNDALRLADIIKLKK